MMVSIFLVQTKLEIHAAKNQQTLSIMIPNLKTILRRSKVKMGIVWRKKVSSRF